MLKRLISTSVALAMASAILHGDVKTIAGVLTKVDIRMIEVRAGKTTVAVTLNSLTAYRMWTVGKLTNQERTARFKDLKVGSRVRVDVAGSDPMTAKTVWIVHSFFKDE